MHLTRNRAALIINGRSGRVMPGVRFLLNGEIQRPESIVSHPESHSITCMLMRVECSEPRAASSVDAVVR